MGVTTMVPEGVARHCENFGHTALQCFCRLSFYANLLGLKIPLGLMVRASRARLVLGLLASIVVPFNVLCHVYLLPMIRDASVVGFVVWQLLFAMWITIPLMVVGSVILTTVHDPRVVAAFVGTILAAILFHIYAVSILQPTVLGTMFLQVMFFAFEDAAILGWLWCLYWAKKIQDHVSSIPAEEQYQIKAPQSEEDKVLIVGNAPTVTDGEPLGPIIDNFHQVVRFNGYHVDDPKKTGSRVTHHFCNGRKLPSSSTVQAVTPIFYASLTHAAYLFFPHMEDARSIYANLVNSKTQAWFVDEELILNLIKKIQPNFWQIPSSGMVAIEAFLSKHDKVTLHGFNFFAGKKIHYFEESPLQLITSWLERFVTHNPPAEKKWVHSLLKSGRVTFLAHNPMAEESSSDSSCGNATPTSDVDGQSKGKDTQPRRRFPGLVRMIAKDGLPSQFSI